MNLSRRQLIANLCAAFAAGRLTREQVNQGISEPESVQCLLDEINLTTLKYLHADVIDNIFTSDPLFWRMSHKPGSALPPWRLSATKRNFNPARLPI